MELTNGNADTVVLVQLRSPKSHHRLADAVAGTDQAIPALMRNVEAAPNHPLNMRKDSEFIGTVTPHVGEDLAAAGLIYASDTEPGIRRVLRGKAFAYRLPSGSLLRDKATQQRIRALAIPPAWTDVWISPSPQGHIQATGRDARGRKQYRYHAAWAQTRDETKFAHVLRFARTLPKIRQTVRRHMRRSRLDRQKVLATVVYLLETTLIRVGNPEYARENGSYGLTTLQDRHVEFAGSKAKFRFRGKTGKEWRVAVQDRRIARIVKGCQDLPGQHLFQYEDDNGDPQPVTSSHVNEYLRQIGGEDISAKDFRTWAGTVLAALALSEFESVDSESAAKRNVRHAIETVAMRLGNTPTICRKCYVHPEVVNGYLEGDLVRFLKGKIEGELSKRLEKLSAAEAATLALLHRRLTPRKHKKNANHGASGRRTRGRNHT